MRRLTMKQVEQEYDGKLPPDAVLASTVEPPQVKPKQSKGRGERFAVLNAFVDASLSSLTGAEAKVWLILFRDVKATTGTTRTGQTDIARRAGLSVRSVKHAVRSLTAKGLLKTQKRGHLSSGPSIYVVIGASA